MPLVPTTGWMGAYSGANDVVRTASPVPIAAVIDVENFVRPNAWFSDFSLAGSRAVTASGMPASGILNLLVPPSISSNGSVWFNSFTTSNIATKQAAAFPASASFTPSRAVADVPWWSYAGANSAAKTAAVLPTSAVFSLSRTVADTPWWSYSASLDGARTLAARPNSAVSAA